MSMKRSGNRVRSLMIAFVLLLGLMPVGAVLAADNHTSSRTDIEFTTTPVEVLEPGEEWVDEAGHGHFRGMVERDEVTGDITGEAIITTNGDFVPGPSCVPGDINNCFEGEFSGWGSIVITDQNGTWTGDYLLVENFLEGEEPFAFGKVILAGKGGNAGKSIVADLGYPEDGDEDAVILTGTLSTLGVPATGINMHTQLCLNPETFELAGAFTSTGAIESSGSSTSLFIEGGTQWTDQYGLYVELVFTDDHGSMTIQLLGQTQDTATTHVGWGQFVIVGGTGAYADLYGQGNVTGYGGEFLQCEAGYGVHFQLLGNAHLN